MFSSNTHQQQPTPTPATTLAKLRSAFENPDAPAPTDPAKFCGAPARAHAVVPESVHESATELCASGVHVRLHAGGSECAHESARESAYESREMDVGGVSGAKESGVEERSASDGAHSARYGCVLQCVLQCVAVCTAVCCLVLQCDERRRSVCAVWMRVAVCCSVYCSVLQCALQCVAVCYSAMSDGALSARYGYVLQCVRQCAAVSDSATSDGAQPMPYGYVLQFVALLSNCTRNSTDVITHVQFTARSSHYLEFLPPIPCKYI